jgi:Flp pilus assembly pilin Flp
MAEYTIVLGCITLAIVTSYSLLSGSIASIFDLVKSVFS